MEDSHQNKNADQSYFFGTLGSFLCHIADIEKINVEKNPKKLPQGRQHHALSLGPDHPD